MAVGLWVIDGSIIELNAHVAAREFYLVGREVRAVVSDDAVGDAITVYNPDMKTITGPDLAVLTGLASIHLVNLSTMTSKYFFLWVPPLRGPTMSSPQTTKGHVMGIVWRAVGGMWP